ncbi:glutathione S-transferase N-terminal domain-containing protein [Thalassobius sp. Cn5-15]|uniref:glutathione S-transferase N-terminal domain-containing protein n=1 Tax=Thalassobius sp. Cn5-15 TaxID=2917763 RepID=UPI001EF381EE|nr:glutathione S-transferase N-terminal domain-containing protein [Thalassobius sp. Cn5-15]MCG7493880.1 glutathione S-transferase N-terminal domain-containing protein [Thalassobius sp. Cn5-15]
MSFPTDYPINNRWPAKDPSVIQLYSFPTPNGIKVSLMLEESGLAYEPHTVTLADSDVRSPEFLSLSPNNKIPALIDPTVEGEPVTVFESGAILIYLAEKSGQFLSTDPAKRAETLQWLMWQMGGLGPMFGQLGYFTKFAGAEIEDPRPRERFLNEGKRLLNVLNGALDGKDWVVGDYSIADMAIGPWLNALEMYGTKDALGFAEYKNVVAYLDRFNARPAVQRAKNIPPRP